MASLGDHDLQPQQTLPVAGHSARSLAASNASQRVREVMTSIVDGLSAQVLEDGQLSIEKDPHGQAVTVKQDFRPNNPVTTPVIRRSWVLLCFAGAIFWLLFDMLSRNANGLVPGITDSYLVNSMTYTDLLDNPPSRNATAICSCTYSSASSFYSAPPYSTLVVRDDQDLPSLYTLLDYCDNPNNLTLIIDDNSSSSNSTSSSKATMYALRVLQEFFDRLTSINIFAPATAILLQQDGWKAARFAEVLKAIAADAAATQAVLNGTPETELPAAEYSAALDMALRLQGSFSKVMGVLLDMPEDALTTEIFTTDTNQSVPLNCNNIPSKEHLPWALMHWCKASSVPLDQDDNVANCNHPYQAYVNFCGPALCHVLTEKSRYFRVMQVLAAIGGLSSILWPIAFGLLWRVFVSIERRVSIDDWFYNCVSWLKITSSSWCVGCCGSGSQLQPSQHQHPSQGAQATRKQHQQQQQQQQQQQLSLATHCVLPTYGRSLSLPDTRTTDQQQVATTSCTATAKQQYTGADDIV